ncbi:hypothetical protein HNP84_006663 [Thermocatellispora tengchongensis]|uniref:DUF3817 domain-containing protein n=1 Tax=Thermocatellispora tengchongensis TaxID=1073253 RepID=A0A840PGE5_9ACTN|nr:DUF3817 domain-containing protein [Thermocatellispora tengchongensis]MBB5136911.1 hypothetical protein [Thermocatellispora tengchongensis]
MRRTLRIAAAAELVSLIVLLANLATVHLQQISSLMGPLHGCAYLLVVLVVARDGECDGKAKALALLPGIGGLLVLRRLTKSPIRPSGVPRSR